MDDLDSRTSQDYLLLLLGFITSLLGLNAGSQLSVLDALPQLLIESFLCLYHFCISIIVWQVQLYSMPREVEKFSNPKNS